MLFSMYYSDAAINFVNQRRQFYKLLKSFIVSHDIFLDRQCKNLLYHITVILLHEISDRDTGNLIL